MGAFEDLAKSLTAAIGENAAADTVKDWIDTQYPPLNEILSGDSKNGLPQGRLIEMFGPSSSGKTAIATWLMIQAQRAGGIAGFADHEKSFDVTLAQKMGLDTTFPRWIYKRPKTWEESNTMIAKASQAIRNSKAIPPDAPILWVFDSIAAAMPKSQAEKEMDELTMNDTTALARVTSTTLKTMASHASDYNFTVIYLNQIRLKPGVVYGDPTTTPGGQAMEFYATTRIALSRSKLMEERMVHGKKEKVFVGQQIKMKTVKNKLTRPFQETSWNMMFNDDGTAFFDLTGALLDHLTDIGKVEKSGAFITWIDGKKYHRKALIGHINETGAVDVLKDLASS